MTEVSLESQCISNAPCDVLPSNIEIQDIQSSNPNTIAGFTSNSPNMNLLQFADFSMYNTTQPYLEIVKQPKGKMRFRYESEKGSHGCLTAEGDTTDKRASFPTVKLHNYDGEGPVYLQASLYTNESTPRRHVHGFTDTTGELPIKDGIYRVEFDCNRTIELRKLNIKFCKRKDVAQVLYKRKVEEQTSLVESSQELRLQCNEEAKSIDLNCVLIGFEALVMGSSICPIVYSNPISHHKSDLKIVRSSRCTGSVKGNDDVFLFVEKVDKKNIEVLFVQRDKNDDVIWEAKGIFNEGDVHHQYAIALKTPPYKELNIDQYVYVSMYLYCPKQNEMSEPVSFRYKPVDSYTDNEDLGRKRKRASPPHPAPETSQQFTTSSSPSEASPCSTDLSETGNNLLMELDKNLENGLIDDYIRTLFDKDNFKFRDLFVDDNALLFHSRDPLLSSTSGYEKDSVAQAGDIENQASTSYHLKPDDIEIQCISIESFTEEFDNKLTLHSNNEKKLISFLQTLKEILKKLQFECVEKSEESYNNILHLAMIHYGHDAFLMFVLLQVLRNSKHSLINQKNKFGQTPVVLAIQMNLMQLLGLLLKFGGNPLVLAPGGNTLLHVAIEYKSNDCLYFLLRSKAYENIDAINNNGYTPLHCAIMAKDAKCVKILCSYKANVNEKAANTGKTALHLACEYFPSIIAYLMKNTSANVDVEDYAGITAFDTAVLLNLPEVRFLQEETNYEGNVPTANTKICSDSKEILLCAATFAEKPKDLDAAAVREIFSSLNDDDEMLHNLSIYFGLEEENVNRILKCANPAEMMVTAFLKERSVTTLYKTLKMIGLIEICDLIQKKCPFVLSC